MQTEPTSSPLFPFGVNLWRGDMPPIEQLLRDMELLKKHGFTHINLPLRKREDDLSACRVLVEHAFKLELEVTIYLQVTTSACLDWFTRVIQTLGSFTHISAWSFPPIFITEHLPDALRAVDPLGRPIYVQHDEITALKHPFAADLTGVECFPTHNALQPWDDGAGRPEKYAALAAEMCKVARLVDRGRSITPLGAPLWAELQGGPENDLVHTGRVPSAEDLRRWLLTSVGAGATGITFSGARGRIDSAKAGSHGLLDNHADSSARLVQAVKIGAALQRHAGLFSEPGWEGAQVGILVDQDNIKVCTDLPAVVQHLEYSIRGWHRLLWELGIPADFVDIHKVNEDTNRQYRVLVLPFPLSLSKANAQAVGSFVYAGGGLICEAPAGRLDEEGHLQPEGISPVLSNLFGAKPLTLQSVREPGETQRWMQKEYTWGDSLEAGKVTGNGPLDDVGVQASLYVQTFELGGSQPVFMFNGRAAGTFRVGIKGWAWLVGTLVGHSATAYAQDGAARELARRLLELCGVFPAHSGRLLLRKRAAAGKQAWFITNPTGEEITETIATGSAQVEDLLGEPFEQDEAGIRLTVKPLDVRVLILNTGPAA